MKTKHFIGLSFIKMRFKHLDDGQRFLGYRAPFRRGSTGPVAACFPALRP
jgi:hypothetical protein